MVYLLFGVFEIKYLTSNSFVWDWNHQIMLKIAVLRSVNYKQSNTITKNTRTVSMWYNTCDLRSDISKIYLL